VAVLPAATAPPDSASALPPSEELVFESDWLASRPFFYNLATGAASANINEVIELEDLEFDPEGFNDFLDFGFSVFEHTPVRDVRMLRYSSRLYRGPQGLRVEHLEDPAREWYERRSTVDEVLEVASAAINEAAAGEGELVVPTSGGFDSRLINLLLHDRSRVRAFTYGVSDDQLRSLEVIKAQEVARRLGLRWESVPLGEFHRYLDDWDALYGVSTHAHGMYQMEFYRQVRERVAAGSTVLSGICGDWFSGAVAESRMKAVVDSRDDILALLRVGSVMCADSAHSRFRSRRLGAQRLLESEASMWGGGLPRLLGIVRNRVGFL
jgi:asparagine synthetase B (glutamine-hydrolysing)